MDCPSCRSPLIAVERDGIELDWCPACKGFWFDAGELDLLAAQQGLRSSETDLARFARAESQEDRRDCPRCDRPMEKVWFNTQASVLVDRCQHGLWFDQGEFGRALTTVRPTEPGAPTGLVRFLGESFPR